MKKSHFENLVKIMIVSEIKEISINWIALSEREAVSGVADRVTALLLESGYRPEGRGCCEAQRKDYVMGRKVEGRYIRLPQETWTLEVDLEAAALAEIDAFHRDMLVNPDSYFEADDPRRAY